ncbi:MAG: class II SORL domain-containing protein [Desulfuromonadales bacterium]|uniref:class II SORL domain-containing protein n=1 Tax=Desulfuromonas sp. KJ2020 TaxID=2919173 RepID=UPI0003256DCB|nr:class II SORL domain-containing protein [Desulfuromonas sp. KJ2020]MCP3176149.1 class II SORL domain-containing protein [Desulfuromonas sp. KJ2020]
MSNEVKRREFLLTGSTVLAAGLFLSVPRARAAEADMHVFTVKDPANKTLLEQKHVPVIEVPESITKGVPFPVTVTVGEVIHPMTKEHYIDYVELYVDGKRAGKATLTPGQNAPKVTFFIALEGPATLKAREFCNLHGLWEETRQVAVG